MDVFCTDERLVTAFIQTCEALAGLQRKRSTVESHALQGAVPPLPRPLPIYHQNRLDQNFWSLRFGLGKKVQP